LAVLYNAIVHINELVYVELNKLSYTEMDDRFMGVQSWYLYEQCRPIQSRISNVDRHNERWQ